MAQVLAPEVRSQFAQRLKTLRTQRGFDRARYFAKSLGIEENRYTRYERAEVEPSLTLIHKMCEMLRVSPNELLGFGEFRHAHLGNVPGLAEPPGGELRHDDGDSDAAGKGAHPLSSLAWKLASEAVAMRHEHGVKPKAPADPLALLRETGTLFSGLQAEPFETVAAILGDPALKDVDAKDKTRLAELIQAYTARVSEASAKRAR
ncbi:MAG TPA: helix-turn-helix transcriptional regulator [Hyphomicrobiaceae bacterium]|nr:helix-turn-helix transcriptional regulator [Hyphomicrobiaceae bacterium]